MLGKYKKNAQGKLIKIANVYTSNEHGLNNSQFHPFAVQICQQLKAHGYETYIVGGAVRDLLLGIEPKDFDIATQAHPNQIKKVLKKARIIGRRFKLVHLPNSQGEIFEIATFRANEIGQRNVFGSLEEDAFRRDFTLNALYYNPIDQKITDFHKAFQHIKQHLMESILPLPQSFTEDPVRMIRAIKYSATTDSKLSKPLQNAIKKSASELSQASSSRLSEELLKVLTNPKAKEILESCYNYGLLAYWLPTIAAYIDSLSKNNRKAYWLSLNSLHNSDNQTKKSRGRLIFSFLNLYINDTTAPRVSHGVNNADDVFNTMKQALTPMILPNTDLMEATQLSFVAANLPWKINPDSFIFNKDNRKKRPRKD